MAEIIKDSTEIIFETECIGDSLAKINTNFFKLDAGLFKTSTTLFNLSAKVDNLDARTTEFTETSPTGPFYSLPVGYTAGGIQLTFNKHNYSLEARVKDSAINTRKLGGDITYDAKYLLAYPHLSSLADVTLTSELSVGNVLKWNGTGWNNEIDVGRVALNELNDTYIPTTPTSGFVLRWDPNIILPNSLGGAWTASRDLGRETLHEMRDVSINVSNLSQQDKFYLRYDHIDQKWKPDIGSQPGLGLIYNTSNSTFSHGAHTGQVTSPANDPLNLTIGTNQVGSRELADSTTSDDERAVGSNHIKSNAIVTRTILDGNITGDKLSGDTNEANDSARAVSTNKIQNNAVTDAKLRSTTDESQNNLRAVTSNHIRTGAVVARTIEDQGVTEAKLRGDNNEANDSLRSVSTNKIQNNTVTAAKLRSTTDNAQDSIRAVTRDHIRLGAVSLDRCSFEPVTQIQAGTNIRLNDAIEDGGIAQPIDSTIKITAIPTVQWFDAQMFNIDPAPIRVVNPITIRGRRIVVDGSPSWQDVDVVDTGDGTTMNAVRMFRAFVNPPIITFNTIAPCSSPARLKIYWYGQGDRPVPAYNFNRSDIVPVIRPDGRPSKETRLALAPSTPGPIPKKGSYLNTALWTNNQVFIGGVFGGVGATPNRRRFARIDGIDHPNINLGAVSSIGPSPILGNGAVHALENFNAGGQNYIAVGGTFSTPSGRRLVIINNTTGGTQTWYTFDGPVYALHARGNFLYVGGKFTRVKRGISKAVPFIQAADLCRINLTTFEIDIPWTSTAWRYFRDPEKGVVFAIKSTPTRLFVGGNFQTFRGPSGQKRHKDLAAFSIETGDMIDFASDRIFIFNGAVRCIAIENPDSPDPNAVRLYVGGNFTQVRVNDVLTSRSVRYLYRVFQHVVAFRQINDDIDIIESWNPKPNHPVWAIDVDYFRPEGHVYIGGPFTAVWTSTRRVACTHIAAITRPVATSGEQVAGRWRPAINGPVHSIQVINNLGGINCVLVAGNFNQAVARQQPQVRYFDMAIFPTIPLPPGFTPSPPVVKFRVGATYAGDGGNLTFELSEMTEIVTEVQPPGNINITTVPIVPGTTGVSRGNLARFMIERVPYPEAGGAEYTGNVVDVIGASIDWDTEPGSLPPIVGANEPGGAENNTNIVTDGDPGANIDRDL